MKTKNFEQLIRIVTGRNFTINTNDIDLKFETEYCIYRELPITKCKIRFTWKTPKSDDKILRSFVTAFTSKYREPNPANYTTCPPYFSPSWSEMTAKNQEYAYSHHSSNMYSKDQLLKQVEDNFSREGITSGLLRYGFYDTQYGIGIFCFWMTNGVKDAIKKMSLHLNKLSIPFTNEFSDAKWVFRFKIGLTKESHLNIISGLTSH